MTELTQKQVDILHAQLKEEVQRLGVERYKLLVEPLLAFADDTLKFGRDAEGAFDVQIARGLYVALEGEQPRARREVVEALDELVMSLPFSEP